VPQFGGWFCARAGSAAVISTAKTTIADVLRTISSTDFIPADFARPACRFVLTFAEIDYVPEQAVIRICRTQEVQFLPAPTNPPRYGDESVATNNASHAYPGHLAHA
jgi:hypothetical protein